MSTCLIAEKSDTSVPLDYTITRPGVGGVTGQSPTVAIRKGSSTGTYLDFSDATFKTSGWTTKYASLTEIERGHYQRILDLSAITEGATAATLAVGEVLVAEYRVDDSGANRSDDHDLIRVVRDVDEVVDKVWDELTSETRVAGSFGQLLKNKIDATIGSRAVAGDAMALTVAERAAVAAAILDLANGVEVGYTPRQTLRLVAAVLCGKASGGPGASVFRSMDDSADRVTSTSDASGNRTVVLQPGA